MTLLATMYRLMAELKADVRPQWWATCGLGRYRVEGEPLLGPMVGGTLTVTGNELRAQKWTSSDGRSTVHWEPGYWGPNTRVISREELAAMYPDPVRAVGEDGSVVYAPLHFEHPALLLKGKLKE